MHMGFNNTAILICHFKVAGQDPLLFLCDNLLGLSHKNKAWRGRGTSVLKIEMLIKQPRSRRQRSETQ